MQAEFMAPQQPEHTQIAFAPIPRSLILPSQSVQGWGAPAVPDPSSAGFSALNAASRVRSIAAPDQPDETGEHSRQDSVRRESLALSESEILFAPLQGPFTHDERPRNTQQYRPVLYLLPLTILPPVTPATFQLLEPLLGARSGAQVRVLIEQLCELNNMAMPTTVTAAPLRLPPPEARLPTQQDAITLDSPAPMPLQTSFVSGRFYQHRGHQSETRGAVSTQPPSILDHTANTTRGGNDGLDVATLEAFSDTDADEEDEEGDGMEPDDSELFFDFDELSTWF